MSLLLLLALLALGLDEGRERPELFWYMEKIPLAPGSGAGAVFTKLWSGSALERCWTKYGRMVVHDRVS